MITALTAPYGALHKKLMIGTIPGIVLLGLAACQTAPATASAQTSGSTVAGAAQAQTSPPGTSTTPGNVSAPSTTTPQRAKLIGMANPASVHCVKAGGRLEIRTGASGGQYGICHMPDGNSCEEWSFFRTGQCKAETLKNR